MDTVTSGAFFQKKEFNINLSKKIVLTIGDEEYILSEEEADNLYNQLVSLLGKNTNTYYYPMRSFKG